MEQVSEIDIDAANMLCSLQQSSYENNNSLVFCCMDKKLEKWFDEQELLEIMNYTPTETEAWDIIQMEEIEREMFED